MKNVFFIFAFALLMVCCKDEDDSLPTNEPTLNGPWSLVNVYGGFAGVDDDFESGLIIWNFDEEQSKITVANNNTNDVIHSGYPSGTYSYELITTANDTSLVIGNTDMKITNLTTTQLKLDEGYISDGFLYTFSR